MYVILDPFSAFYLVKDIMNSWSSDPKPKKVEVIQFMFRENARFDMRTCRNGLRSEDYCLQ